MQKLIKWVKSAVSHLRIRKKFSNQITSPTAFIFAQPNMIQRLIQRMIQKKPNHFWIRRAICALTSSRAFSPAAALRAFLIPLALIIGLSFAAPTPAYAATGNGTFDCLGDLDWGCNILGFLFERKGLSNFNPSNHVITIQPNSVQNALHAMMGFFSNAILIIASLKLLFELIQMTAETAHTGQVGGKDANTLWAPIRLVLAIGLLVPLSSGLNSGQYIILQIAKWGSGLGSQVWFAFTKELNAKHDFSVALNPAVKSNVYQTLSIYACVAAMNHFAIRTGFPDDAVTRKITLNGDGDREVIFSNRAIEGVCGSIKFKEPSNIPAGEETAKQFALINLDTFTSFEVEIEELANKLMKDFLDNGIYNPTQTRVELDRIVKEYKKELEDALKEEAKKFSHETYDKITSAMNQHASQYGWISAGSWFLAISRAQGQVMAASFEAPLAKAIVPSSVTENYPSAGDAYSKFYFWLAKSPDIAASGAGLKDNNDLETIGCDRDALSKIMSDIGKKSGGKLVDAILDCANNLIVSAGVWPSGRYDDAGNLVFQVGNGTDPFGDLIAFGHNKIRAAIEVFGIVLLVAAGAIVLGALPFIGSIASTAAVVAILPILGVITSILLIGGILLAFILPLLPFMKFFFGIVTWLGTFLEAMISLPLLALAHLTPKGDGFSGPNTRSGYFLIFQIFLRPALMIFGLIAALLIFYISAKLLGGLFNDATRGIAIFKNAHGFVARLIFSIIYVVLLYVMAITSFRLIDSIPTNALRWMNANASEDKHDDHQNLVGQAATYMGGQMANTIAQGPANFAKQTVPGAAQGLKTGANFVGKFPEQHRLTAQGASLQSQLSTTSGRFESNKAKLAGLPAGPSAVRTRLERDIADDAERLKDIEHDIAENASDLAKVKKKRGVT